MDAKCNECDYIPALERNYSDVKEEVKGISVRLSDVEKETGEFKVEMIYFAEMLKEIKADVKDIKGEKQRRLNVRKSTFIGIFSGITVTVIAFLTVQAIKIIFNW